VKVEGAVLVRAPAKVNLVLEVGGRRPDGYHDLDTLFQAVSLWDEVRIVRRAGDVTLTVDGPDLGPAEENLAVRAARIFLDEIGAAEGVALELRKDIPAGAGLGGGSSDAAAVLRGLDRLFGGAVPAPRLRELGGALGSDVPFFLGTTPLARGTGRGEVIQALQPLPVAHLVLVLPPVHVATGRAYAALAERRVGHRWAAVGSGVPQTPSGWAEVRTAAHNDFEEVVLPEHAAVRSSLDALRDAGASPALLSGSGSACFGLFPDQATAQAAAQRISEALGWSARAVVTLTDFPEPQWERGLGG